MPAPHAGRAEPLILLDVDGVINLSNSTLEAGWTGHLLEADGRGAYVEVRDELHDLLLRLSAIGEVVWASGWNDGAPLLFAKLIPWLGSLPHITFPGTGTHIEKLPTIQAYVGDRTVVWIDDRIPDEAWEWAKGRAAPTLLVPIDPMVGLCADELMIIEKWVEETARGGQHREDV